MNVIGELLALGAVNQFRIADLEHRTVDATVATITRPIAISARNAVTSGTGAIIKVMRKNIDGGDQFIPER